MQFDLPNNYKRIIDGNNKIKSALYGALSNVYDLVQDNTLEFFPEFTDHGISHIQSVINKSEDIISDEAIETVTAEDVYVIVCSILLHDCAMHMTKSSLWKLLGDEIYSRHLYRVERHSGWMDRWNDFALSVNRFDQGKWESLYGEYVHVKVPNVGKTNLTDHEKILIGDFVRQYHADVAQVIAEYGFPSADGPIKVLDNELDYLNKLSGFVARSHNYNLRDVKDVLGEPECIMTANCHPTFIMGVLRIADYLQFEKSRTPKIMFKLKGIASPYSIREWKKQISIISTHTAHRDREMLFVEAYPNDAVTMRDIKGLLFGLQSEIDDFWSVLGEVYSRDENLRVLGINIRRVRSNIDNGRDYVNKSNLKFYHEVLNLRTDDERVYPLLIKPLYGNIPQIGLRELLQNAVDSCRERYSAEMGRSVTLKDIPYGVKITLDFKNETLIVEDNGVGMTVDVINEYFLRIGASYRYSEEWKATHVKKKGANIPRTGKFGVGMLAGFLLGEQINVSTKKL